ncbi:MAG: hypothetical protein ACLSAC_05185 [Enterocloster bolteae]
MLEPVIAQMAEDTLKEEMNLSGAGAVTSVTREIPPSPIGTTRPLPRHAPGF